MPDSIIAPFFKGVINDPSPVAHALLNKKEFGSATPMDHEQYLRLFEMSAKECRALCEDVARTMAAVLLLRHQSYQRIRAEIVAVEGCLHNVGGEMLYGSSVMARIKESVVPKSVAAWAKHSFHTERVSACTLEEVRAILRYAHHPGTSVQGITHDYHARRTEGLLTSEAGSKFVVPPVRTPEHVANMVDDTDGDDRFMKDVILAAKTRPGTRVKEFGSEMINNTLHAISSVGERVTGKSLEIGLAHFLRSRRKL